jgi:Xaa-Pro aminopeptidase
MISMEPVLKRGYTAWDRDVLPADEFLARLQRVRAEMRDHGLDALVIVNYSLLGAMFDYADIAYVGGLQSGGVLVICHDSEPTLLSFGGGRELFFMREQTWLRNLIPGRGRTFDAASDLLAEHGLPGGRVGTVGLPGMPLDAVRRFQTAFEPYDLVPFDTTLAALRAKKRPRELLAIGIAKAIVEEAAAAAASVFESGGDNTAALLEAERIARFKKARDVRALVNMSEHELRPFEGRLDGRHAPLLLWVAAQYHGYWAETAVMSPADNATPARRSVDAMAAAIRSGAVAGDVAEAGLAMLPGPAADAAQQHGLGGSLGLAQNEGLEIARGSTQKIQEGSVISLLTFTPGTAVSIASRIVVVTEHGAEDLAAVSLD